MTKPAAPAIVLATNDEPRESSALRFAAAEALRTGYPLRVVHVVHGASRDSTAHPLSYRYEDVDASGQHVVDHAVQQLVGLTHGAVPIVKDVFRGRVLERLVALSAQAHLVVVQRRGLPRRTHPLTSSTTAALAGRSMAPVACVPTGWDPGRTGITGVTCAVGVLARPTHLMVAAFDAAREHRVPLVLVHAVDYPAVEDTESSRERDRRSAAAQAGLERSTTWLGRHYPDVAVTSDVVLGEPERCLLSTVDEHQLLVVGRRDAPHPMYEHVGSVTRKLLRTASVPVVVIPRPSDVAKPRPESREHRVG